MSNDSRVFACDAVGVIRGWRQVDAQARGKFRYGIQDRVGDDLVAVREVHALLHEARVIWIDATSEGEESAACIVASEQRGLIIDCATLVADLSKSCWCRRTLVVTIIGTLP